MVNAFVVNGKVPLNHPLCMVKSIENLPILEFDFIEKGFFHSDDQRFVFIVKKLVL